MKPSQALNLSAKVLLSLTLLFVCPLFLPAQSKDKKSNPPPPPPQQQPQRQQPPPQQQPQRQPQPPPQQQQQTNRQQPNQQHVNLRSVPPNLQPVRDATTGRSTYKDKATGRQWETNTKGEVTRFSEPGREVKFSGPGKPIFIRDEKRG